MYTTKLNTNNKSPETIIKVRFYLFVLCFFLLLFQLMIDFTIDNIYSSIMAFLTSIITFYFLFTKYNFQNHLLLTFICLAPCISLAFGPILVQSFYLNPIIFNLKVPIFTFTMIAYYQLIILLSYLFFINSNFLKSSSSFLQRNLWERIGVFKIPNNTQLWIFGFLGLSALVFKSLSTITGGLVTGDSGGKFLDAFGIFTYAPLMIPIFKIYDKSRIVRIPKLIIYFILILIVSLMLNSRGAFSTGIASLIFLFIFLYLADVIKLTKIIKKYLIFSFLLIIIIMPILGDLSTAMLKVRSERYDTTAFEMINKTLDAFLDKKGLENFRKINDFVLDPNKYNEYYVDNPFLSRFLNIKYADILFSSKAISEKDYSSEYLDFLKNTSIALIPMPFLSIIGIDFDKDKYAYSFGDLIYYLDNGNGLGGFRVGSPVANLYGILGYFMILSIPFYSFSFIFFNSFEKRINSITFVAPVFMFIFIQLYYILTNDSLQDIIQYLIRGIPQLVFLYLIVIYLTNIKLKVRL